MDLNQLKPKKFLSLGHHDLPHVGDLEKDFFIAVGCSYTAGAGLRYTDTWASRLGKKLNMEHINLGLDGSSFEYQYDKIIECEKIIPNHKFIIWMQTHPIRSHRNKLFSHVFGDLRSRIMINEQLFRGSSELLSQWNKVRKYVDLVKDNKKIFITNSWHWDPKLLLLLEQKICRNNTQYMLNRQEQIDTAENDSHPGPGSHGALTDDLCKHINVHSHTK